MYKKIVFVIRNCCTRLSSGNSRDKFYCNRYCKKMDPSSFGILAHKLRAQNLVLVDHAYVSKHMIPQRSKNYMNF